MYRSSNQTLLGLLDKRQNPSMVPKTDCEVADDVSSEVGTKESDASPEAAGITRGAVKTATNLSKRGIIGRLPKPSSPPVRPVPKTQLPRLFPNKRLPLKARRVAKISDRISTGFDAYDAATSVVEDGKADNNSSKGLWKKYGVRLGSFAGMLFKNTLLGTAAFEAYEKTIEFLVTSCHPTDAYSKDNYKSEENISNVNVVRDVYAQATVMQHFNAGIIAGSAHSSLALAFQSSSFLYTSGWKPDRTASLPSLSAWGVCHTMHHSISYAILFSTYEASKRLLTDGKSDENNSSQDMLSIGFGGGIAGQFQHIASHYTEFWLRVTEEQSVHTFLSDIRRQFSGVKFFLPGPSFKSTILAFPPSAIGFIAFEYGKGLVSSDR